MPLNRGTYACRGSLVFSSQHCEHVDVRLGSPGQVRLERVCILENELFVVHPPGNSFGPRGWQPLQVNCQPQSC